MNFPSQLIKVRKKAKLTQQALADEVLVHVNQIRRYESGASQPTLDTFVRLAEVLSVSLDELVSDITERALCEELALQFEAVNSMPEEERHIIRALLDGMILRYQAKKITERG